MRITGIRLREYRSYERLDIGFVPGLNVLLGENAAGKTNVLEAIFLCALGRSHRTRHDSELIRNAGVEAGIGLTLEKRTGNHSIKCRLRRDGRRSIAIDDMPLSRSGELLGCLHVVMFSPEDLKLIKQGPSERRRFLDMELSQLYPAYYYALQRYNVALRQRNALLKSAPDNDKLHAPFEEQLASLGNLIHQKRAEFCELLAKRANGLHGDLTSGKEELSVSYQPSFLGETEAYTQALMASRSRDAMYGSTSIGPHRDDLLILLDGVDVRAFGSQGQQRTAALSLKLSELMLINELEREPPVLLLDDVMSELDRARQRCLIKAMRGCQTFLTCTQLAGLRGNIAKEMTVFEVKGGNITMANNGNTKTC